MTVLSANAEREIKAGVGYLQWYPVEDNVHIYKNALVVVNAAGYALPLTAVAAVLCVGIAYEECDNTLTGKTQGGKGVRVRRGCIAKFAASSIAQSALETRMYGVDDNTVDETAANSVFVGKLVEYISATEGWVDMQPLIYEATTKAYEVVVPANQNRAGDITDWVEDVSGLTLTLNKTAKTAIVPVQGLLVGDVINTVYANAGIGGGAGKATSLDVSLYKVVSKAGGHTDASVQAMDQISKEEDYFANKASKAVAGTPAVAAGEAFYFLITGTTANDANCDIVVTSLGINVTRGIH